MNLLGLTARRIGAFASTFIPTITSTADAVLDKDWFAGRMPKCIPAEIIRL